ncbi:MAG: glycoside hydrolase [Candidatus Hydrogenedentes bacterium]|nr:glycoside hydrolase [Candidatus Hydrogenedentota bacterium]
MKRWKTSCVVLCVLNASAMAQSVVFQETFDGADLKQGQSVKQPPLSWTLLSPNDPAKNLVGDLLIGKGPSGLTGNCLEGSTAAAPDAENSFQKTFAPLVCGKAVLTFKALAAGETSAGSSVGMSAMQAKYSNRGGGWISTPTGWTFWTGHVDSSTYPLGDQKFGPYEILQDAMSGAHDVPVNFTMTVDLDRSKAWGEARWLDAQGKEQSFKSRELDWDTAAGDISSVIVTIDKRSGHTGILVDDIEVSGQPASLHASPFEKTEHLVRHMDGDAEASSAPAELHWISREWGGENAQIPYLAYAPEKNRVLMLVACGSPIHSAIIESENGGATWSERRWLSVDDAGQPNATALGLTQIGSETLLAYPESLGTFWISTDYGRTWSKRESQAPAGERYAWDPLLVLDATRLAQAWWKPTGIPWGSAEAPYSQAYIRFSNDAGLTWSEDSKVPQWLGVNEVCMIRASNGNWIAACRTDSPKRFAHWAFDHYSGLGVSISSDEGKTWSYLNVLYEWGRHHPSMVLLPDGRILMTYAVRLGYPNTPDGFEQFGVEAVISNDNGQTWDLAHRYILAKWTGNIKGENAWFCSVQSSSTVMLEDGTLLTAFGTGFRNKPGDSTCVMSVALVRWRL